MASCDVQATPPNGKSVNASIPATPTAKLPTLPPTSPATLPSTIQTSNPTSIPIGHPETVTNPNVVMFSTQSKIPKITETSSNGTERSIYKNDIKLPPTKIPAPIRMENTCSVRKYTTLMKGGLERKICPKDDTFSSTSTLVNLTEDSGIQMDCSAFEDDVSVGELNFSQPQRQLSKETLAATDSFLCLDEAEQQTLRVLQRAVAEMEADVALHSQMLLKESQEQEERQIKETTKIAEAKEMDGDRSSLANHEPETEPQADPEEVASSSRMCEGFECSSARSTIIRERKHVRVEQLLEAEHDIELLQKLLRPDNQLGNSTAETLHFDELPQSDSNITDVDEKIVTSFDEDDDKADRSTTQVGFLYSLLNMFCGKSIRKISYPLLFCGMAVGLIFYLRKI